MSDKNIKITINFDFNAITGSASDVISTAAKHVHIAHSCINQWDGSSLLPEKGSEARAKTFDNSTITIDDAQDAIYWIFLSGIRDITDEINSLLLQCYRIASFSALIKEKPGFKTEKSHSSPDSLIDEVIGVRTLKSIERMGIERKIEEFASRLGLVLDEGDALVAFGKLRNCLAHRGGVVAIEDCNSEGDTPALQFTGYLPVLMIVGPNGDAYAGKLGVRIEAESQVNLRFEPIEYHWPLGEPLVMQERDFDTIAFSVLQACQKIVVQVQAFHASL